MTQLTRHPALLAIEDKLDAIGQKYRSFRIVRGAMLWLVSALAATVAAALLADRLGAGRLTSLIPILWIAWLAASAAFWFIRPLLLRPKSVEVARLVESRVDGLHNGLTNSVLLSQATDLADSPWLDPIFNEIADLAEQRPLGQAVKFADLRPTGLRLLWIAVPAILLAILLPNSLAHGWQQMFAPATFVPRTGHYSIVSVEPGDVSLVVGQPLDIAVTASGPQTADASPPQARLVFDSHLPPADLTATQQADNQLHYAWRLDHVDQSLKYRVEVGDTQSQWYSLQVVPEVKLQTLDLKIRPPLYTGAAEQDLTLTPADIGKTPLAVPQGSQVELAATIDIPMKRAELLVNNNEPLEMTASADGRRFTGDCRITSDSTLFIGVLGGDQIIAKLPEQGLSVQCIPDSPPTIIMQSPAQDIVLPPTADLTIKAQLKDDYGVTSARLMAGDNDADPALITGSDQQFSPAPTDRVVQFALHLQPAEIAHNASVTVQISATDNRDLTDLGKDLGPQTTNGPRVRITFRDPKQIAAEQSAQADKLTAILLQMLQKQVDLNGETTHLLPAAATTQPAEVDRDDMAQVHSGQVELRDLMHSTGDTFNFDSDTLIVQKTLKMLELNPATEAVDLSATIVSEPLAAQQIHQGGELVIQQQVIITTLRTLLARLGVNPDAASQLASHPGGQYPDRADAFKKLDEALKTYMAEQKRILNQTATLAKKPVDNYDTDDKKNLDELRQSQEKLDAYMQQALADFSKNAEQDLSNPSLLKEMAAIYSDVTMAADALNAKPATMAVPLEENGLESAKELEANLQRWLANTPDRTQWQQEDQLVKNDVPMPELPKELQDMVGQLMEQQEDLDQSMEDANANWQDSMDKGVGWDAADGPIADMSAKGVTGNVLPNDNEMQGRSGEGRNGRSQGEFVGDTAVGKGGRDTPTRVDPTPFEKGQIQDTSKDPVGGATGGGKMSGEGASGLEGPVPPPMKQQMERLAKQEAQIRNSAERLNLQYQLDRYDNFKLMQSILLMRRMESDLDANRYQNAMRDRDEIVSNMETSRLLLGGKISVEQDTTPAANGKTQKEINDATQGDYPAAWSDALKEYYRKLATE